MNPCPHPVESAQRAGDEDKTITPRRERREGVPSPEEMAAEYIKVRDLILAAPVTPPGARP